MDYFVFDLQLFADVEKPLNVTDVAAELATATKYCTVKDGTFTWHSSLTDVQTAVTAGATFLAQLTGGTLKVAAADEDNTTVKISGATAAQMKGVTIALVNTLATDGATVTPTAGSKAAKVAFTDDTLKHMTLGLNTDGTKTAAFDATTACKVTGAAGASLTIPSTEVADKKMTFTATAGAMVIEAPAAGGAVISSFDNGKTATLTEPNPADGGVTNLTTTMAATNGTDGKVVIAVDGAVVGRWVDLDKATGTFTIPADGGDRIFKDSTHPKGLDCVDFPGTAESLAGALTLSADKSKPWYAVTYTAGAYTVGPATNDAGHTEVANLVGYFKLTIADNVNKPSATLVFYKGITEEKSEIIGKVRINAEALDNISLVAGGTATLKKLTVTGVTSNEDEVFIHNLAPTATVTGIGSESQIISYAPTYEVAGRITLTDSTADGTKFYVVRSEATSGKNTKVTWTITSTAPASTTNVAYYNVAYNEGTKEYTVTYVPNGNTGATAVDMTKACWAGVAIDATGLTVAGEKKVIVTEAEVANNKDTYAVSALSGVGVKVVDGTEATITRTNDIITSRTDSVSISLAADKYYAVTVNNPSSTLTTSYNDGTRTIAVATGVDSPPSAPYFHVSGTAGDTVTVEYVNTDGSKRLSGLVDEDGNPFRINIDASTLGAGKALVIDDGATLASTNVDYAISHLPAGTNVTGATEGTGKGTDTLSYDNGYVLSNTIALSETKLTSDDPVTTYYKATATEASTGKGVLNVTLTKMTTDPVAADDNYFAVTATKVGEKTAYQVAYHKATGDGKGIDLSGATGKLSVSTANLAADSVSGIYLVNNEWVSDASQPRIPATVYEVKGLDEAGMVTSESNIKNRALTSDPAAPTDTTYTGTLSYVDHYALGTTDIDLSTGADAKTYFVATTTTVKGTHTIDLAGGVHSLTEEELAQKSYFLAEVKDGVVTLSFSEGDGTLATATTAAELGEIAKLAENNQFTVSAGSLGETIKSIVLSSDATTKINYAVENVPYSVTNGVSNVGAGDTVTYTKSYVLSDSANSIALGSTEGKVYYAVTATGGKDDNTDRGRYTCSIASSGVTIKDDDPEKAEKIAALGGNYFTVATAANGNVTISYTSGGTTPLNFTTIENVVIDAAKAAQGTNAVHVTFKAGSDTGSPVGKYTFNNLTKYQDTTKGDETVAANVTNYETSYEIANNNIVLDITTDAAGVYPAVRYYSITRTEPGNGIIRWTLSAKLNQTEFDALGADAKKHYVKISYDSAWNVSVAYVNTDGAEAFDLSNTAIGRLKVEAKDLKGTTVDTLNIDKTDQANYEITGVVQSQTTVNCDTTKDVVNYDVEAKLADGQKFSLTADDEAYYLVTAPKSGKTVDVTACTVAKTTKDKCTDTANYFKVAKSGSTYTITYVAAKSGDALNLRPTTSTIAVDASAAKSNSVINVSSAAATVALADVPGAATIENAGNVTATYKSTFAWAEGAYYLPVDAADAGAAIKAGTVVPINPTDNGKLYAKVAVTLTDGVYEISAVTVHTPDSDTGVMSMGTTYTGLADSTIAAPAVEGWKFNANNIAFKEIKGLSDKAELTNAASVVKITSATLASGAFFTVGATTYVSGAASNVISVTGAGRVESGTLLLTKAGTVNSTKAAAAGVNPAINLIDPGDGVVVVFDKDKGVTSISDLEAGEIVQVTENDKVYQYTLSDDGKYIEKTLNESPWTVTKAGATTGDILALNYQGSVDPIPVGQFLWSTGTYYLADSTGKVALAVNATSTGVAQAGTTYVKATIDGSTLTLESVKGNAANLVDATDYEGTVTIANPQIAFTYSKATSAKFTVAVTGAKAGSSFANLGAKDTVATAALAAGQAVTVGGKTYTAASADTTLSFAGLGLQDGTISMAASTDVKLADGSTVAAAASTAVTITAKDGKLTSLKGMETTDETVTVTTYAEDGTTVLSTKVYTAKESGATVEMVETIAATGQKITQVFKPAAAGGEVLGLTPESTVGTITSDWAWGTANKYGYFKANESGAVAIGASATPLSYTKTDKIVKATITKVTDTTPKVNTLTLTPMIVGSDGVTLVEDTAGAYDGVVTVTLPSGNSVIYDGSAKSEDYTVKFVDANKNSELTLAKNDSVTTVSLTVDDSIVVNGTTFKRAEENGALAIYSDGKHACIESGIILTTGTVYSAAANLSNKATLAYTPGETNKDGVTVKYTADGVLATVKDLEAGETVTITGADGKVTKYEGRSELTDLVWKTVDGVTTVGTFAPTASILADSYTAVVDGTDDGKKTFDWGETAGKNVSYSLLDTDKNASVAKGDTLLSYKNAGKTYLVGTYETAAGEHQYELTFQKATVKADGKLNDAAPLGASDVANVTIDAGGKTVKYAKSNITGMTVTNAGAGSAFTSFTGNEISVSTKALATGETLTIGTTVYTSGADNNILSVDKGKVLGGTFRLAALGTFDTSYQNATTKETITSTVTCNVSGDNVNVKVSEGKVAAITGLDALNEQVTVATTTKEKDGTSTSVNTVYKVTAAATNAYTIQKTETVNGKTTKYTQTFTKATQDVTTTTGWAVSDASTTSQFDWTNTGYFEATLSDKEYVVAGGIKAQASPVTINSSTPVGTKYVVVESKQNLDGSFTVSNISLVEVQKGGSLTAATGTIGAITVTAPAAGLTLPTTHDGTFTVTGQKGLSYTVADQDTVKCTFANAGETIAVGGTTFTNKAAAGTYLNAEIMGDGTVTQGHFLVKGTMSGSAIPDKNNTTAMKTITYTAGETNKDGVEVTFKKNVPNGQGEIDSVTDLEVGEKVVIDHVRYTEKGVKSYQTTTVEATATTTLGTKKFTKTIKSDDFPIDLVMTATTAGDLDVTAMTGFQWENKFDFGATKDGVMGIFAAAAAGDDGAVAVATQNDENPVPAAFGTDNLNYVIIGGEKKNGAYTISHLQLLRYTTATGDLNTIDGDKGGIVTITPPTDGNLTLASDAYQPNPDSADKDAEATRRYAITVMGTAGKTYTGFAKGDSVKADLEANTTITVGGAEYKAAIAGGVTIGGTGVAQKGSFEVDSAKHKVTATEDGTNGTKVVEWTKGDGVRVTVSSAQVTKITGLGAGEEVKVTTTTADGAKTVETYSAAKGASGLTITKTVVAEGSTTKYTTNVADDTGNILGIAAEDWTKDGDVTTTSKFDWTAAGGAGFFELTGINVDGKKLGAVTVEPQSKAVTITKANKGKYYLKVVPEADNTVSAAGVYSVDSTGALQAVVLTGYEGTIKITAPSKALTYANVITEANVKVDIVGAAKNSVITLKTGDTLTTAALANTEAVTVNGGVYTAGAAGALSFARDESVTAVVSGTLKLGQAGNVKGSGTKGNLSTDNMDILVSNNAGDQAVVTIANGVVAKVESLTGTLTTTQNGVQIDYTAAGLGTAMVTNMADTKVALVAKLKKGATLTYGGVNYLSGKDENAVTLVQEGANITVQDGTLTIAAGDATKTIYAANTSNATDNFKIDFTRGTGSTSTPTITIEGGKITAIEGLAAGTAGDKLVITETPTTATPTTITTYQLDATGTKVTKTVKVGDADATTSTAFIAKGSDLLKASFINGSTEGGQTLEDNPIVGQFSWNDISGRATGYFDITDNAKNTTSVVEQSALKELKVNKNADKRYVVATVSNANDLAGTADAARALSLGAMKVTKAGVPTTEGVTLTAADTIKIAAPTAPVVYSKAAADAYHVEFTKVAKNSIFNGLAAGDKVTTDSLAVGDEISLDGGTTKYVAGAKGQLVFIGQTTGNPAVNNTALLSGTIKLSNTGGIVPATAVLAGDSKTETGTSANDVTVTVAGTVNLEDVIVKVANGKVSSITGVKTVGTTVSVAITGGKTYTYTALDANAKGSTMFSLSVDGGAPTYRQVSAGTNFYGEDGAGYKTLANNKVTPLNWDGAGAVNTYVTLDNLLDTATIAKGSADLKTADFNNALPDSYYLNLKGNTALKNNISTLTVTGLSMTKADGTGALKASKDVGGILTIDTALGGGKYAAVVFKLPTGTARTFGTLSGTVGLGSDLTNLANNDKIDTADGKFTFGTNGKQFKIYKAATNGTEETLVTYTGSDKAEATVAGQVVTAVTGMTTGKLTIAKNDEDAGLITTVYEWKKVNNVQGLYRTITAADGTVTVDKMTAAGAGGDIIGATYEANAATAINSVFDWTLDKSAVGYFAAATNGTAAVKALTTNIKDTRKDSKTYVKVTLNEASKTDARVDTAGAVTAVKFNATTGAEEASKFDGKLTITAPKTALTFDRATAFDATMAGTTVAITGAATGSNITGLAKNDTVTTASLTATGGITLGGLFFSAGKAGVMEFTVQEINTDDLHYTLTKGTASLSSGGGEGFSELYAGTTLITAEAKLDAVGAETGFSSITVQAATTSKGTTFTIGGISENERFTIKNPAWTQVDGNGVTFTRSGSSLFCTYYSEAEAQTVTKVYTKLGSADAATITSAILEKAFNDPAKVPTWSALTKTFDDSTGVEQSSYLLNVDLAQMDSRITKEKNTNKKAVGADVANYTQYEFVVDKYVSTSTKAGTKLATAIVGNVYNGTVQESLGHMTAATTAWTGVRTYVATDHGEVGQTIKAAANWSVTGSAWHDTITGAASGYATINGGAGNDTITGGGASETFEFNMAGGGKDVLKSYTAFANNKGDKLDVTGFFDLSNVYLAGTGLDTNGKTKLTGVLLHDGTGVKDDHSDATNSMLLVGVAGKAVRIGVNTYYFGDGTKTKGAATFNYQSGAYYLANSNLTNTLKVATDKNKATKTTLGDTVEIDLNAKGAIGSYYTNINALDASASANRMILTASEKGSTVKGGTYQTTLRGGSGSDVLFGGSGADVFSFKDGLGGADTIKSYTSKSDAVYVGQLDAGTTVEALGIEISAQGNNVVLKQNSDTVTIENAMGATKALRFSRDGSSTNTMSYYIGKAATKNNFTEVNKDADYKVTGIDSAYKAVDDTTVLKEIDFVSRYIGSTNDDTVKLKATKETISGAISLADANLSSIDILDASLVKAGSTLALIGGGADNCTLKGSASNLSKEKFFVQTAAGKTTVVQNLTAASDIIELAGGLGISGTGTQKGANVIYTLNNGSTLQIDGVKVANLQLGTNGAGNVTIKRTK